MKWDSSWKILIFQFNFILLLTMCELGFIIFPIDKSVKTYHNLQPMKQANIKSETGYLQK